MEMEVPPGVGGGSSSARPKKQHWTQEEDELLRRAVARHRACNWRAISAQVPGQSGDSCRWRWRHELCPSMEHGTVMEEEDAQVSSQYKGVRRRPTGNYEAQLSDWDGQKVKTGTYDTEYKAARAYDLAVLKYRGPAGRIYFPLEDYKEELKEMKKMTKVEYIAHLRRRSDSFSRGSSMYRGMTRQDGSWQAQIGGGHHKNIRLGIYSTQEDAAKAYDIAAIKFHGHSAVTNFDINNYDVEKIMNSNVLVRMARTLKTIQPKNGG